MVTGTMGAGKSSLMALLKAKSYPVFKSDDKAKELLRRESPCYNRLRELFGESGFNSSTGEFDRQKLAGEIFKNSEKRKAMEAVIHPLVWESFLSFAKKHEAQTKVFCEFPLILEGLFDFFDQRILIFCPKKIKKSRLIKQGWPEKEIEKRWAVQRPDFKIMDKINFVIDNSGNLENLKWQIEQILPLIK